MQGRNLFGGRSPEPGDLEGKKRPELVAMK
jgi:hypothetical protein